MTRESRAIDLGLIRFAPPGRPFPGRGGNPKPYVVDTRGAGSNVGLRDLIVDQMRAARAAFPDHDVVAGIAKSGTIWAAWLAWAEGLPFANVLLDGPRASGLQREVEGDVRGRRVLLIDNWARSGRSLREGIDVVDRAGGRAIGVLTVVRDQPVDLGIPHLGAWELKDLLTAYAAQA